MLIKVQQAHVDLAKRFVPFSRDVSGLLWHISSLWCHLKEDINKRTALNTYLVEQACRPRCVPSLLALAPPVEPETMSRVWYLQHPWVECSQKFTQQHIKYRGRIDCLLILEAYLSVCSPISLLAGRLLPRCRRAAASCE